MEFVGGKFLSIQKSRVVISSDRRFQVAPPAPSNALIRKAIGCGIGRARNL
jgi:hypothetical protein